MKQAGNAYWVKYINYIITYGSYGNGTGENVGICAFGEGWGYHIGRRLIIEEFGNNNSFFPLASFENHDPVSRPSSIASGTFQNNTGWTGWIPSGLMHDLTDTNTDLVRTGFIDNASGYTNQNLFDAMDSDVLSPQQFRDRLLLENGNIDRADVLSLFEAYFWN
jgi:hypothetical protein